VKKKFQNVDEKQISNLFDGLGSKTLKSILIDCCKIIPKDRSTFRKILDKYEKSAPPSIIKELDVTETIINSIWTTALTKFKATNDIEFGPFYDFLVKYFKLSKPEEYHYLKEALRLTFFFKIFWPRSIQDDTR